MTAKTKPIVDVTFYVTRDSLDGALMAKCDVWTGKPVRNVQRTRVTWVQGPDCTHTAYRTVDQVQREYGAFPETDLELIKVETRRPA